MLHRRMIFQNVPPAKNKMTPARDPKQYSGDGRTGGRMDGRVGGRDQKAMVLIYIINFQIKFLNLVTGTL